MPTLIVHKDGWSYLAECLRSTNKIDVTYHLFKNNYTPVQGSIPADFEEADFSGYSGGITVDNFDEPVDQDEDAIIEAPDIAWAFSSGLGTTSNDIYGYFVLDGSGNLLWSQRPDDVPKAMALDGDQVRLVPTLTLRTERPPRPV